MSSWRDAHKNGMALKAIAISLTIGYWILVFESRADTIRQGGYEVDPATGAPLGQAGTPINLGYALALFMVIYFPPVASVFYLGVLQQRKYDSSQNKPDDR